MSTPSQAFADAATALFGDAVDLEQLWAVSKIAPGGDPSEAHAPGILTTLPARRVRRRTGAVVKMSDTTRDRLGAGLGVISMGVGAKELGVGVGELKAARKLTGVVRRRATIKPAGKIAGGVALLGGDVMGTMALNERATASKGMNEVVDGTLHRLRTVAGAFRNPGSKPPPFKPRPYADHPDAARGRAARADFDRFAATKTGKGAMVVGGGYTAVKVGGGRQQSQDGYYAKRAPRPRAQALAKSGVDDVVWGGTFAKFDEDKHLAFGWASVVEVNGSPVVDRQGDYIGIDDIESAAYVYVEKSRVGGDMHRRTTGKELAGEDAPHHVADLVESMVFTPEKIAKMGLPHHFPVGWWVGYKVHDEDTWQEVKKGNRSGFSIHGKGLRKDLDYDSLMMGG